MTDTPLAREIAWLESQGVERVTVAEFGRRFAALGYRLDRSLDCRAMSRYMSGPRAGDSYPCCDTGLKESDTGLSAWNINARRDANFQAMQAMRGTFYAVTRGHILEV